MIIRLSLQADFRAAAMMAGGDALTAGGVSASCPVIAQGVVLQSGVPLAGNKAPVLFGL